MEEGRRMLVLDTRQCKRPDGKFNLRFTFPLPLTTMSSSASGKPSQHSHWFLVVGGRKINFLFLRLFLF